MKINKDTREIAEIDSMIYIFASKSADFREIDGEREKAEGIAKI